MYVCVCARLCLWTRVLVCVCVFRVFPCFSVRCVCHVVLCQAHYLPFLFLYLLGAVSGVSHTEVSDKYAGGRGLCTSIALRSPQPDAYGEVGGSRGALPCTPHLSCSSELFLSVTLGRAHCEVWYVGTAYERELKGNFHFLPCYFRTFVVRSCA